MSDELHIASLVVHAVPARLDDVARFVASVEGARVHASAPTGKLVVTLEAPSGDAVIAKVNSIQQADGVTAATLVFQYADARESMMQEVADADQA